jgi:hypothetical protein
MSTVSRNHFLDLPPETRFQIYREILLAPQETVSVRLCQTQSLRARIDMAMGATNADREWGEFGPKNTRLSILFINRLIRYEAMVCFLSGNDFVLSNPLTLLTLLEVLDKDQLRLLRKLTLNLTPAWNWYHRDCIEIHPRFGWKPREFASDNFVNLRQVTIMVDGRHDNFCTDDRYIPPTNQHGSLAAPLDPVLELLFLPGFKYSRYLPEGESIYDPLFGDMGPEYHKFIFVRKEGDMIRDIK